MLVKRCNAAVRLKLIKMIKSKLKTYLSPSNKMKIDEKMHPMPHRTIVRMTTGALARLSSLIRVEVTSQTEKKTR